MAKKGIIIFISLCLFQVALMLSLSDNACALTSSKQEDAASTVSGTVFKDIGEKDPLRPYTRFLFEKGIISGFPDGTFRPAESLTRAQAARMAALTKGLPLAAGGLPTFSDVSPDHWAYGTIEAAAKAGLFKGYPDGSFGPENIITRAEALTLLLTLSGGTLSGKDVAIGDVAPGHWAYRQVATAVEAGLVMLSADNLLHPDLPLRRDELAKGLTGVITLGPALRPGELTGKLRIIKGEATLTSEDGSTRLTGGETGVSAGTKISTSADSQAEITFDDGSGILIDANTEIVIKKSRGSAYMRPDGSPGLAVDRLELDLKKGKMFGALSSHYDLPEQAGRNDISGREKASDSAILLASTQIPPGTIEPLLAVNGSGDGEGQGTPWWEEPYSERERVVVNMPWGVAGIRGTFWTMEISAGDQSISLIIGNAVVTAGGRTVSISGNQYVVIPQEGGQPTAPVPLNEEQQAAWQAVKNWVVERARDIGLNLPPGIEPAISITLTPLEETPATPGTEIPPEEMDILNNLLNKIEEAFKQATTPTPPPDENSRRSSGGGPRTIHFNDAGLEAAVRDALSKPAGNITVADMAGLTGLDAEGRDIADLTGLEYAVNLQELDLCDNQISNISALAALTGLRALDLDSNQISDISDLAALTGLRALDLDNNRISNVSPLAALTNLQYLGLAGNRIGDIGALAALTGLQALDLAGNQIENIGALAGLTGLQTLYLGDNQITDLSPLVANGGLGDGDRIYLDGNPLNTNPGSQNMLDIQALQTRGATVSYQPSGDFSDWTFSGLWRVIYNNSGIKNEAVDRYVYLPQGDGSGGFLQDAPVGNYSFWYGRDSGANHYTIGNYLNEQEPEDSLLSGGTSTAAHTGSLTTPAFYVPQAQSGKTPALSFLSWWEIESVEPYHYDLMNVYVIKDGTEEFLGKLNPAADPFGEDYTPYTPYTSGGFDLPPIWKPYTYNLGGFQNTAVKIRFDFDTVDDSYNAFRGWLINDIQVALVDDYEAPPAPIVNIVTIYDTSVTGTAEPWSTIAVEAGASVLGTAVAAGNGAYTVAIPIQAAGTVLSVTASDVAGNVSAATVTTVITPSVVSFNDASLEAAVRDALSKPTGDITDVDMARLTELYAEERDIADLTGLEYAVNLQALSLWNNQISDVSALAELASLQALDLAGNQIIDISPLAGLANLQGLFLEENQISNIDALADLPNLLGLSLSNNQISNINPLAGLIGLQYLYLEENKISDISGLTGLPKLQALALDGNQIGDISDLTGLPKLQYLTLESNQISTISGLTGLPKLQALDLADNRISDISHLANLTSLEYLFLGYNQIDDLSALTNLIDLTVVDLVYNQITDLSPLVANGGLGAGDRIYLDGNPLDTTPGSQNMLDIQVLQTRGATVSYTPPAPAITAITAADSGGSPGLGNGDTLTIVFDVETNQPPVDDKAAVDALIDFGGKSFGADYSGAWTNAWTLTLTVDDAGGGDLASGDTLTLREGGNLRTVDGRSPASTSSGVIGGSFGGGGSGEGSTGNIAFDASTYSKGNAVTITVIDSDLNTDSSLAETVSVSVYSSITDPAGFAVALTETGPDTGVFEETILIGDDSNPTVTPMTLGAGPGEIITAVYTDAVDETGAQNQIRTCSASITGLGAGEVRIVLTWGETPPDLDAHLTGHDLAGDELFHVFYGNSTSNNTTLDVDETEGFGPETITISQLDPNIVYRYWVHHFTNGSNHITDLANSNATVLVYTGWLNEPVTYTVPSEAGTIWNVFELNGSTKDITRLDYITTFPPEILDIFAEDTGNNPELGEGDTLTIAFDLATNQPTVADKAAVDTLIDFGGKSLGTDYSGVWDDASTLVLTVRDATYGNLAPGDTLTLKAGGNLRTADGRSTASTSRGGIGGSFSPTVTVHFNDPGLEAAVRDALSRPLGNITDADMTRLTWLYAYGYGIADLTGLEYAVNLQILSLGNNQISDISALAELTSLQYLFLEENRIGIISGLAGLTNLQYLFLGHNQISDISDLAGLTSLQYLFLEGNRISDISDLAGLTDLQALSLGENQIIDISHLANLTDLQALGLDNNRISDISHLANLTSLQELYLGHNQIGDLSALTNLAELTVVDLVYNQITDLSPLVANGGLGAGDSIYLDGNPLDTTPGSQNMLDIQVLQTRGATVSYTPPAPAITAITAADSGGNPGLGDGDTLTITFDAETNQPAVATKGEVDNLIDFGGKSLGTDYSGVWTNAWTLKLTVRDATYGDLARRDNLALREDGNLRTADGRSPASASSGVIGGSFGGAGGGGSASSGGGGGSGMAHFHDANLEAAVRNALNKPAEDITDADMAGLTELDADGRDIGDLTGLEYAVNLQELYLGHNQISDLSALVGLAELTVVDLVYNQITDLSPLVANNGLGAGDSIYLDGNPLNTTPDSQNMLDIQALEVRGVIVRYY